MATRGRGPSQRYNAHALFTWRMLSAKPESGSAKEGKPEAAAAEALRAAMAGRGKLIAVVGDEDTVTGFLLGGVGELNAQRKPNFLVVEKETSVAEIEETFRCGPHRGWGGG